MLTISKPLNPAQLKHYHDQEFSAARDNYYTQRDEIVGSWHGRLTNAFGLTGAVDKQQFDRLADGQHPLTGALLVRLRTARDITQANGQVVSTMEHRAGWDLTFSAPKGVSISALVGGDERIRAAHVDSVSVALAEAERYTQARISAHGLPETSSVWTAARFEHDSARPVQGYSAPQLHTHTVVFNMTETLSGTIKPIQPHEWYKTQALATNIYRAELALRLQALGYQIERGAHGEPQIIGYTQEYLDAASPRRKQILDKLAAEQRHGAASAQIAAHQTRERKVQLSPEVVKQQHQEMAAAFGDQPARVVAEARVRAAQGIQQQPSSARHAVTYARDRNHEKAARFDERAVKRDALDRGMGHHSYADIRREFESQVTAGVFVEVDQKPGVPGRAFTTPEMLALERENIALMLGGQRTMPPLAAADIRRDVAEHYPHLSQRQRAEIEKMLANGDKVQGLEGIAGGGKTTALAAVRDAADRAGYHVHGLAPTSGAAIKLGAEAQIPASTLQRHLAQPDAANRTGQTLWILDESSLSSTLQMRDFLARKSPKDRVLLVGDIRQHEAVDAGRPYAQLQEAGLAVARLDEILRQKDPALKEVVEDLAAGRVTAAVHKLEAQGRVHQIPDRHARYEAMAAECVAQPTRTLIVSPDNESRRDINSVVHHAMQTAGHVAEAETTRRVLVPRQDLAGADRQWAKRYNPGDVIRYTKGSEALGIQPRDYARVISTDAETNWLTVRKDSGRLVSYDPARLSGVAVYQEHERQFAVGDRLQFTAPDTTTRVANRQLGTIEQASAARLTVKLDTGRRVTIPADARQHLDYGYAGTSHALQSATTDIILVHVDVDQSRMLVNQRFIYVAVSRGRDEAKVFTNDSTLLAKVLNRNESHESALSLPQTRQHAEQSLSA